MMGGGLVRYVGARLGRAALTIVGVVTLVFLLIRLIPGDPIDAILGDQASPEDRAALRATLHLDRPFAAQYLAFASDVWTGTLGTSFRKPDRTVASLVRDVLPSTIELAIASIALAWMLAIPLGTVAAMHRGTSWDRAASTVGVLGLAIPNIWLGPLLVLVFGVLLRVLPLPGDDEGGFATLVLPAITVGTALAAILTRQTRAAMSEVLSEQYILAARARGVGPLRLAIRHALRNALLPVLTVGAAQLGALLSGTVIAEKIFERPGLGTLFLEAFFARDIPVVQGCVLLIALVYVSVNLLVDLLYGAVDPRVRLA